MKSKMTATLLCFFLGNFGAHWWYLGNTKLGIIWLLTCGCFGLGTLINFFQFLMMKQPEFDAKYNSGAKA